VVDLSDRKRTVYKNAFQVWKAGLVSSSQGDTLSGKLLSEARQGAYPVVEIAGRKFQLAAGFEKAGK
jgi:hypothetical protein